MTHKGTVDACEKYFGGGCRYEQEPKKESHNRRYVWETTGSCAQKVAKIIFPYAKLRKDDLYEVVKTDIRVGGPVVIGEDWRTKLTQKQVAEIRQRHADALARRSSESKVRVRRGWLQALEKETGIPMTSLYQILYGRSDAIPHAPVFTPTAFPVSDPYFSGLLDAEGYVKLTSRRRKNGALFEHPVLVIGMIDEPSIRSIRGYFNTGNVTVRPAKGRQKPVFVWAISGKKLRPICERLLPFSITKARGYADILNYYNARD